MILGQFAIQVKNNNEEYLKNNIKKFENIFYPEVIRKYIWTFILKKDKFFHNKLVNDKDILFSY